MNHDNPLFASDPSQLYNRMVQQNYQGMQPSVVPGVSALPNNHYIRGFGGGFMPGGAMGNFGSYNASSFSPQIKESVFRQINQEQENLDLLSAQFAASGFQDTAVENAIQEKSLRLKASAQLVNSMFKLRKDLLDKKLERLQIAVS